MATPDVEDTSIEHVESADDDAIDMPSPVIIECGQPSDLPLPSPALSEGKSEPAESAPEPVESAPEPADLAHEPANSASAPGDAGVKCKKEGPPCQVATRPKRHSRRLSMRSSSAGSNDSCRSTGRRKLTSRTPGQRSVKGIH